MLRAVLGDLHHVARLAVRHGTSLRCIVYMYDIIVYDIIAHFVIVCHVISYHSIV